MKLSLSAVLIALLAAVLSGCSMLGERGARQGDRAPNMSIRSESRESRWQRMKNWEEERYDRMWDRIMD